MTIKIVDELPVFQKLSFGDAIYIKGNSEALLQKDCLNVLEVISILIFVLGVVQDFLDGRVGIEMIEDATVYNTIS